jgi:predicted MFS family arabinose efflux permease
MAILAGITLARIAFGYQLQTVGTLGPALVAEFGIGYAALGTLIGLYMLPGAAVALPSGLLGRRFGEGKVLGLGLTLMAAGNLLPLAVPGWTGLAVARVAAGTGAVTLAVMQGKIIADWFRGGSFVAATGLVVGGFPIGVGLCQLITPPLTARFGWRAALVVGGGLALVAALLFILGYRQAEGSAAPRRFALPSRRECLLVLIAGLVWTAYNCAYFGFLSYVPSLMHGRGHGAGQTALAMTLATWPNIPAILLGGMAAARLGNLPVFAIGMTLCATATAGMGLTDHWLAWPILFGTLGSIQPGVIVAAGTLSARAENRAVGMGIFYTTYYIGGALSPAICGRAADLFGGPQAALATAAIISALALPLFWLHQSLSASGAGRTADAAAAG